MGTQSLRTPSPKPQDTLHHIDGGGVNNTNFGVIRPDNDITGGPITGGGDTGGLGTGWPSNPYLENNDIVVNKNVDKVYSMNYPNGVMHYGTFDNSKELMNFKPLGFSIILFIFSIYLFTIATRVYRQYFDDKKKEEIFDILLVFSSLFIIILWISLVIIAKGIPSDFWIMELMNYPNQFVLGVVLSSLLLLVIGTFRFTMIALIQKPIDSENGIKIKTYSIVGFVFGLLNIIANLITVWSPFK